MWIWRWWQWLCGYVVFQAQGGMCERFLSLLSEGMNPVKVWQVQYTDGTLTATCRVSDYKRVRPVARRTGTRVRHIRQCGFYRWWRPIARRTGLFIGVAAAMALYMVLACAVWVIDVQVEDADLRRRIEMQLAASGMTLGTPIRAVDVAAVRMDAIANIEELHQLSLYFEGCVAHVEVRLQGETLSPPDPTPANIVAAADGLILATQVTAGQSMVQVGEAVVEGELLVCGAIETEKGVLFKHAAAIIRAQTTREVTVSVAATEWESTPARVWRQPTLCLFTWQLPLYSPAVGVEDWVVTTEDRYVTLFGTQLPLGVRWTQYEERVDTPVTRTAAQVEALAEERLAASVASGLGDAQVLSVSYAGVWDGEVYRLTGTYTCVEDIAKTVPLLTDLA